ncbi:MoaD/ThiS family protein [Pleomorphovibrio marinus]|uniref:MoaD/ThiS family protein n=1 Tax=Pleomorphovibrio marinus TaxID=2164132 RepID=UPI000E0B7320|nr:MoaD/ThiS family protein [Pleomorphovibrio marinus]
MNIRLFGITKDIIGAESLQVPNDLSIHTVRDLKHWLYAKYPDIKSLKALAVAVDHGYAEDGDKLSPGNEIALIPPVSGG